MNHTVIAILGIVCLIAVAVAGCTGIGPSGEKTPTPTTPPASEKTNPVTLLGTPIPVGHIVATEAQNGALVDVNVSNVIILKLAENPTTGFRWNLSVTPGLNMTNDTYIPSDTSGTMVGSGGTHVWEITAIKSGVQTINATYLRSWEPVTGNETAFVMTVNVT